MQQYNDNNNQNKKMLNQSLESDKSIDPEKERQRQLIERQKSIEESIHLNVKDHMIKLDHHLLELNKDLENSKKDMSNLRMEVITLKNNHQTSHDDLSTFIFNETARLQLDLKKRTQDMLNDFEFYDAQLKTLKEDKQKLDDVAEKLDKRIISQCI
ncbi:hypothetical protein pb186bvf_008082 [Paramecium bursaria]